MQQIKHPSFPTFLDDFEALQEEIKTALKRTWLTLAGLTIPCAACVICALAFTK